MEDRLAVAMTEDALKIMIDIALNKAVATDPNSKSSKLAAIAGDGAGVIKLDLASLIKTIWPQFLQIQERGREFPLKSMPETKVMAALFGLEMAVIKPGRDGIMLETRGQVPLSKYIPVFAMGSTLIYFFLF